MRTQRLLNSMKNLTIRTLRDCSQRIIGEGNKIKGAIKECFQRLNRLPKLYIEKWKKYIQLVACKSFLDSLKTEKLKNLLQNIVKLKLRGYYQRIIGEGSRVKGALRRVFLSVLKKKSQGLQAWKNFVQGCHQKKFFDNLRSEKLKKSLLHLQLRTIKAATLRIISGRNRAKSLFKTVIFAIEKLPKRAFRKWKLVNDKTRIIKNSLKDVIRALINRSQNSFDLWKRCVKQCREKQLLDRFNSTKLKYLLEKLCLNKLKGQFLRIIGNGSRIKGGVAMLIEKIHKIPRNALRT